MNKPSPIPPLAKYASRVFEKTDRSGACWLWTGYRNSEGYAWTHVAGRHHLVHRFSYEALVGPIPDGFQVDHLCKVRHCVNPEHLEAVTLKVNVQRSDNANRRKTHCPQGHAYDEANTYVVSRSGGRQGRGCKACNAASSTASKRRLAARKALGGVA